jgi:hypothetical protein
MTDAPETIWAAPPHDDPLWKSGAGEWDLDEDWAVDNKVAYTPTSSLVAAQARIAELEARNGKLGDAVAYATQKFTHQELRIAELEAALTVMADHYVQLVECGDCGHWDAEDEMPVKSARAAIKAKP